MVSSSFVSAQQSSIQQSLNQGLDQQGTGQQGTNGWGIIKQRTSSERSSSKLSFSSAARIARLGAILRNKNQPGMNQPGQGYNLQDQQGMGQRSNQSMRQSSSVISSKEFASEWVSYSL